MGTAAIWLLSAVLSWWGTLGAQGGIDTRRGATCWWPTLIVSNVLGTTVPSTEEYTTWGVNATPRSVLGESSCTLPSSSRPGLLEPWAGVQLAPSVG